MRAETRHQLKTDKFRGATIDAAERTVHWTVEHQSKLIVAAVVVVIVVAAVLGGWYYLVKQDEKASVDFGKATQAMETPVRPAETPAQPDSPSFASSKDRATEAHKRFQAIVDKYPHSRASDFSHYYLGVTSADLGDYAAAERELKSVAGYHNEDLSSLARMALASIYRNSNRRNEAVDIYQQLINKPTQMVSKGAAEIELAQTYQAAGMTSDAKKKYEQISKEAPQSAAAQIASNKLAELK